MLIESGLFWLVAYQDLYRVKTFSDKFGFAKQLWSDLNLSINRIDRHVQKFDSHDNVIQFLPDQKTSLHLANRAVWVLLFVHLEAIQLTIFDRLFVPKPKID